jgi:Family of unknown function (DUF5681)
MTEKPFDAEAIKREIISGVGYRKPPKDSRFQKGQSGNPLGRPAGKTARNPMIPFPALGHNSSLMRDVLLEPVKVREQGKLHSLSKAAALQRNLEKLAFGGSILATRDLKQQLLDEDARAQAVLAADHDLWRRYIAAYEETQVQSKMNGAPITEFWMLPEDIIFKSGQLTRVRGPQAVEELADYKFL